MTPADKMPFVTTIQDAGERTRAMVLMEFTHGGRCSITHCGEVQDLVFIAANLQVLINEILTSRYQSNLIPGRGNT